MVIQCPGEVEEVRRELEFAVFTDHGAFEPGGADVAAVAVLDCAAWRRRNRSIRCRCGRSSIREALREEEAANLLLQKQLAATLKECDSKEANLLDFAADGTITKEEIRTRLTDIERQRTRVREQLDSVESNLEAGARHLETYLDLLDDPEALYRSASDQERRQLNQAIFVKVLVEDEEITGTLLAVPIATLAAAQAGHHAFQAGLSRVEALKLAQAFHGAHSDTKKGTTRSGDSLSVSVEDLLDGIHDVDGSN